MKTIVYTTIFGGSDRLKPAPAGCDAVCFVDRIADYPDTLGWTLREHVVADPRRMAWYLRCIPHKLFQDYDRVVWIDASFTLTDLPGLLKDAGKADIAALRHHARSSCYHEAREIVRVGQAKAVDVDAQMDAYRRASYLGETLSISCVIVRSASRSVQQFNETWAGEIAKYPGDNTQLSLDYSAWKHGLTIAPLRGTRHDNPYATHDSKDHKRRRQRYDTAVAR